MERARDQRDLPSVSTRLVATWLTGSLLVIYKGYGDAHVPLNRSRRVNDSRRHFCAGQAADDVPSLKVPGSEAVYAVVARHQKASRG